MKLLTAVSVEWLKLRRSKTLMISLWAAVVFPLLIGLVMTGAFGVDSPTVVEVEQTVPAYLMQFEFVVAIGGLIGFGFLFSWIFGREFTGGTVTDLLALPISRMHIVGAKFIVVTVWCTLLTFIHFVVASGFTWIVLRDPATASFVEAALGRFMLNHSMVVFLSMPVALVASLGKGYMASLGFVILTTIAAQLSGAVGAGAYFPWAVPGLYSGVAGEAAMQLPLFSIVLPFVVGLLGVLGTLFWWRFADHT